VPRSAAVGGGEQVRVEKVAVVAVGEHDSCDATSDRKDKCLLSDSASRAPGVGTADQLRPPLFVYLMRMHDGQLLTLAEHQPVSGDIQVESTHHVVVLLAAAVVVDRGSSSEGWQNLSQRRPSES